MKFKNVFINQDVGQLLMRLVFGGTLLLAYGAPTFFDLIQGNFEYADPLGMGMGISKTLVVFGQFFCAILVLLGYKLRWACLPLMAIFSIAFFVQHHGDPFEYRELALLYLGAFSTLFLLGPGQYSIDHWIEKKSEGHGA